MDLADFIAESNRIEGIIRYPGDPQVAAEFQAHNWFINLQEVTIPNLEEFVSIIQSGNVLRRSPHQNVRVGNHIAPQGGPSIEIRLSVILEDVEINGPYKTHLAYENLHPFTDGNGRSGRVLWLWQMGGVVPLGFLHSFYYQTLDAQEERS